jgi:DUF917 family protein
MRLDASNLRALGRGCAMLGAGGGGDPELGVVMALRAVDELGPVDVVDLGDLADEALVMPCGMIGAPAVATERLWNGDEGSGLRAEVDALGESTVAALMCFEIGGVNGLLPVTWAARCGLPLVDADGMGRAFPQLQQQAMHVHGVAASPIVLTDGRGNTLVLHSIDDGWGERLARSAATSLGGVGAGALFCMTAVQARTATIAGSLSTALRLGRALELPGLARRLAAVQDVLGAVVIIQGRVADLQRDATAGYATGAATIRGSGSDSSRQLRLELQSEYLLVVEDGALRAAVPDIICVLAADTGDPVPTDRLHYGQQVAVVAAPAPEIWRSDAGLALVGPRAFGYDIGYEPLAHDNAQSSV